MGFAGGLCRWALQVGFVRGDKRVFSLSSIHKIIFIGQSAKKKAFFFSPRLKRLQEIKGDDRRLKGTKKGLKQN